MLGVPNRPWRRFRACPATLPAILSENSTAPTFDLQSHSIHSDGELPARAVVEAAAAAGVELLALTDHDSTEGVAEARAAAEDVDLTLVTATEISVIDPAGADLHMCGYLVDPDEPALQAQLQRSREDRQARAWRMAAALQEEGFVIDEDFLRARAEAGQTIGRPHLAQAVTRHPDNAERLERDGLSDPTALLVAYLIPGTPAFRERDAPTAAEAIELIHGAGGIAVWAHPFWDVKDPDETLAVLERFVAAGVDGVEAFYVAHTQPQTEFMVEHANRLGLVTTGSSDFHGPNHRQFKHFRAFETYGLTPNLGPLRDR
jgi:predicted metal-dependent phosphoesterase TrpH